MVGNVIINIIIANAVIIAFGIITTTQIIIVAMVVKVGGARGLHELPLTNFGGDHGERLVWDAGGKEQHQPMLIQEMKSTQVEITLSTKKLAWARLFGFHNPLVFGLGSGWRTIECHLGR